MKLFEMEVPEIYDGTVVIKTAVRAPGERAKVAVFSRERDVDPVGACVGMKGSRVQAIIRELRGEKIDIIEYNDDLVTFAQSALAPAKITRVSIKQHGAVPHLDVIVEDEQLSLAIGKRGQNVRLASELIGCKIDIKSETDVKDEVADALARMLQIGMAGGADEAEDLLDLTAAGVSQEAADALADAGWADLGALRGASVDALTEVEGIDTETAEAVIAWAESQDEPEAGAPAAAPVDDSDFMAALSKAFQESSFKPSEAGSATDDGGTEPDQK
jgi:N utilization substance protein A